MRSAFSSGSTRSWLGCLCSPHQDFYFKVKTQLVRKSHSPFDLLIDACNYAESVLNAPVQTWLENLQSVDELLYMRFVSRVKVLMLEMQELEGLDDLTALKEEISKNLGQGTNLPGLKYILFAVSVAVIRLAKHVFAVRPFFQQTAFIDEECFAICLGRIIKQLPAKRFGISNKVFEYVLEHISTPNKSLSNEDRRYTTLDKHRAPPARTRRLRKSFIKPAEEQPKSSQQQSSLSDAFSQNLLSTSSSFCESKATKQTNFFLVKKKNGLRMKRERQPVQIACMPMLRAKRNVSMHPRSNQPGKSQSLGSS